MKHFEAEYDLIKQAYEAGASEEGTRQQKRDAALVSLKYATAQARLARMWTVYAAGRKLLAQLKGNRTVTDLFNSYKDNRASQQLATVAMPDVVMSSGANAPNSTPTVIRGTLPERSEVTEQMGLSDNVRNALEGYI